MTMGMCRQVDQENHMTALDEVKCFTSRSTEHSIFKCKYCRFEKSVVGVEEAIERSLKSFSSFSIIERQKLER